MSQNKQVRRYSGKRFSPPPILRCGVRILKIDWNSCLHFVSAPFQRTPFVPFQLCPCWSRCHPSHHSCTRRWPVPWYPSYFSLRERLCGCRVFGRSIFTEGLFHARDQCQTVVFRIWFLKPRTGVRVLEAYKFIETVNKKYGINWGPYVEYWYIIKFTVFEYLKYYTWQSKRPSETPRVLDQSTDRYNKILYNIQLWNS